MFPNLESHGIVVSNKQLGVIGRKIRGSTDTVSHAYMQLRLNANFYKVIAVAKDEMKVVYHRYTQALLMVVTHSANNHGMLLFNVTVTDTHNIS